VQMKPQLDYRSMCYLPITLLYALFLLLLHLPIYTLFPYTTLFRSQFQKALIAFAVLGKPNLLLFDEPTASLDQLAEERVYELLRSEEHTSELQSRENLVCRLLLEKKKSIYRQAKSLIG